MLQGNEVCPNNTLLNIVCGLRRSWTAYLGTHSNLFMYGTAATANISKARDIDVFAVSCNDDPSKKIVVRVETTILFPNQSTKTASLYIIPEQELLKDLIEHSCGGRWSVIGLHGMWGECEEKKNELFTTSLASVFFHYDIPENLTANEAVLAVTRALFSHYPFYAKSAISIARSRKRWDTIKRSFEVARQSDLYKKMMLILQKQGKLISKSEQQSRYFSSELWSRPKDGNLSDCGISSLKNKIERTIEFVEKDSFLFDNTYGTGSTECVIHGLNCISTWKPAQNNASPSVMCEYGGNNKIQI